MKSKGYPSKKTDYDAFEDINDFGLTSLEGQNSNDPGASDAKKKKKRRKNKKKKKKKEEQSTNSGVT